MTRRNAFISHSNGKRSDRDSIVTGLDRLLIVFGE
jgi:hypothetical protein